VQFQHYAFNLLRLDLGYSFKDNMPVAALIADKLAATAILMIASLGTAFLLGIGLGTLAAVLALIGYATPEALLGICWRKHQKLLARDHFLEFVRARASATAAQTRLSGDNVAEFRRPARDSVSSYSRSEEKPSTPHGS
jgi:ABC-type microcin C transport system permease subunit YejB